MVNIVGGGALRLWCVFAGHPDFVFLSDARMLTIESLTGQISISNIIQLSTITLGDRVLGTWCCSVCPSSFCCRLGSVVEEVCSHIWRMEGIPSRVSRTTANTSSRILLGSSFQIHRSQRGDGAEVSFGHCTCRLMTST